MGEYVKDRTGASGRVGVNMMAQMARFTGFYEEPWVRSLRGTEFEAADKQDVVTTFNFLEFCLTQVTNDTGNYHVTCTIIGDNKNWHDLRLAQIIGEYMSCT